jgi:hypothetical protein
MNELSNYLVETFLLTEAVKQTVVVYGGRFQPFHAGHYKTYKHLCSVFGAKNVYIATSNVQDSGKSPLSFNEKRDIAVKVFGIPPSKFIQVKSPYQPVEILRDFDSTNTALVVALGEKDAMRLGGQYFKPYTNSKDMEGYSTKGYVYSKTPSNSFGATDVRNMFRSNLSADEKEKQFQKFFGKYNKDVFQMLNKGLNETKEFIPGGLSKGMTLAQIADKHKVDLDTIKKEFKKGVNVEMEHTTDIRIASEIAKDHIFEDPKYYDKLVTIEGDVDYEPEAINYEPDELDWENIMNMEIADPATGKKYRIKDALRLDRKEFARQEAMRVLHVHALMDKRQVPGNIEKGQQSPKSDKVNQVNLGLYTGYGEGIVKEASVKGSGYSSQILNQLVKNPKTGEDIKVSSALNYDRDHPAYKSAMMLIAKAGGSDKEKLQKVKQKAQSPSVAKSGETDIKASVGKVAKTAVSNPKAVVRAISQNISKWSKKEKEFFRGAHKPESNERRTFGEMIASKTKGIVSGVKRELKHLGHEVKEATGGVKALFSGQKPDEKQKKAMIAMAKTVGMTVGSIVLSGGAGALLHHGVGTMMTHLGTHLAEHMVGEALLFGVGKAALNAGVEDDNDDKYIEWFTLQLADNIKSGKIPNEVWLKTVQSYNKDKEAGEVSEKDWEGPNELKEMAKVDMDKVEKYADSQLSPEDVVLGKETDHFFQRLNDPRNGKEISPAELTGFFKRLAKNKKKFLEFIKKYNEFVVKDKRTGINIPFMVQANKLIAKTIMRKDDFKSSTPVYTTETKLTEISKGIFGGTIKIGGQPVKIEVELVGADNKTREFITKVVHIDSKYFSKLPIGSTFRIPARIFRAPGGGWHKVKHNAFEAINTKNHKHHGTADYNFNHHHKSSSYAPDYGYEPELDTIDFDDDNRKKQPGHQTDTKDTQNRGYEPYKKVNEKIVGDEVVCDKCGWSWKMEDGGNDVYKCHKCNHNNKPTTNESLLTEGGAYGHMNHPFDTDINLTFKDLKTIVSKALDGNLGVVREKTDGQALAISWKNGRLIAARNKGHLANGGANALDVSGMAAKFAGRGALSDAYNFAMKDLESAIRGLSQAQKDKIFMNGKAFMNLEVIYPTSVNVIPYGQALLVFHNCVEYNEAGNAIGQIKGAESILAGMIKQVNADVQSKYVIQGPPIVKLPKSENLSSQKGKFLTKISKLQSEFSLPDNAGVADYHQAWWKSFIQKGSKGLTPLEIEGLTKRWAFGDKSFRINLIGDEKAKVWADGVEKQSKDKIAKENLMKFEEIFLGVGAEVLQFMQSVLTASPSEALQTIRKRLDATIDKIKAEGTPAQIEKMKLELERLNSIGGFDKIVPNEGIIFTYKGNVFKMTGAFASLNQLLGIFY